MIKLKKSKRHEKILELIARYEIETQEELIVKLADAGFAPVSAEDVYIVD